MQRALEMRRERVVPLFLALPGFSPKRINMGRLFLQPDKNKFLSNSPQLHKKARLLDNHGPFQFEVVDKRRVALNYFRYQKALFRFYYALSPVLAHLLRTTSATQPHDIFLWLVCQRCEGLARVTWPKCDLPVHMALLGAHISSKMAATVLPVHEGVSRLLQRTQHRREP